MLYKYQYKDEEDKQQIISENTDKILIEEQILFDGNFLCYSDIERAEDFIKKIGPKLDKIAFKLGVS
jgi:heme oxygenase